MNWIKRLFVSEGISIQAIVKSTPEELRSRYGHLAQPAVHLRPAEDARFTRLGLPTMPADFPWPEWKGKPLAFLAQIDLKEIHDTLSTCLPADGFLYFFYDLNESVWGYDPEHRGGWRVLYCPAAGARLIERPAPAGLKKRDVFKPKPLVPALIHLLPDSERLRESGFHPARDEDAYFKLRDGVFEDVLSYQMLGFPTPVQSDDMELECQLASSGINAGTQEGYKDPRVPDLKPGAAEWKLLLQLDSDEEEVGWMWGDSGTLYFWIKESDARQADFSKVWMVLQSC